MTRFRFCLRSSGETILSIEIVRQCYSVVRPPSKPFVLLSQSGCLHQQTDRLNRQLDFVNRQTNAICALDNSAIFIDLFFRRPRSLVGVVSDRALATPPSFLVLMPSMQARKHASKRAHKQASSQAKKNNASKVTSRQSKQARSWGEKNNASGVASRQSKRGSKPTKQTSKSPPVGKPSQQA